MSAQRLKSAGRIGLALLVLAGCALFLLACGSGQDAPEALSKPQFMKQADAICAEGVEEKERVLQAGYERLQKSGNSNSLKGAEEMVAELVPPMREVVSQLRELPPPHGDQVPVERVVKQFEAGLKKAEEDPRAAVEHDPFFPAYKSAEAYGLKACSF